MSNSKNEKVMVIRSSKLISFFVEEYSIYSQARDSSMFCVKNHRYKIYFLPIFYSNLYILKQRKVYGLRTQIDLLSESRNF